jgi:hypothetical protein
MLNNENTQDSNQKATTDNSSQDSAKISSSPLPSISLPKGGGAIRGIGEKFAISYFRQDPGPTSTILRQAFSKEMGNYIGLILPKTRLLKTIS